MLSSFDRMEVTAFRCCWFGFVWFVVRREFGIMEITKMLSWNPEPCVWHEEKLNLLRIVVEIAPCSCLHVFICLTIAGLDFLLKDLTFPMYKVLRHLTVDNEFQPFRSRNLNYECLKPENWSNQDQFLSLLYRRAVTLRRITFTNHHYYLDRIQRGWGYRESGKNMIIP